MKLTPWLRSLKNGIGRAFSKAKVKRRETNFGGQLLSDGTGAEQLEDRTLLSVSLYKTDDADGVYDAGHLLQPQPFSPIDLRPDPLTNLPALKITVYFSSPVSVTLGPGRPFITFNTSSTDPNAPNYPGAGSTAFYEGPSTPSTTSMDFWYTIQNGQNTPGPLQPNPVLRVTGGSNNSTLIQDSAGPVSVGVVPTTGQSANGKILDQFSNIDKNIFIDTHPVVKDINSTTPDSFPYNNDPSQGVIHRPYRVGDEPIHLTVTYSEPVAVTGAPELILNTDGQPGSTAGDARAVYVSGSGTNVLHFDYIINPGDNTNDLDVASASALQTPAGSQIRDQDFTQDDALNAVVGPSGTIPGVLGRNRAIQVDTLPPEIGPRPDEAPNSPFVGVTSFNANGTYGAGQTLIIRISFNESVVLTGAPTLVLATGPVNREATFAGFDGTDTLLFTYTVQPGDLSSDLDYVGPNSLHLNGGSLTDNAGNIADVTLPLPGAVGSLSFNKNIVIDTLVAVTNVTTTVPSGSYGIGQVIPIQVFFNKTVTVFGTPQLILDLDSPTDSVVVNYSAGSGTKILTFNYTIQAGHNTLDLDYISNAALQLNGGAIIDTLGNGNAVLTLPIPGSAGSLGFNKNILIDTNIPQIAGVSASASVPDGTYVAGQTIPITVTFNEPVSVTGKPQITLDTNGIPGVQPFLNPGDIADAVVNYTSGSGTSTLTFNYTIALGQNSLDLDGLFLQLANGSLIKDLAGNDIGPTGSILTLPQFTNESLTNVNVTPNTVPVSQVDDITVGNVIVGANYSFTVSGNTYSYVATGADTQATIATKLRQAVNQNPVTVTASGFSNIVRLTSKVPGTAFNVNIVGGSPLSDQNVVASVAAVKQVDQIIVTSVAQGTVYDFVINGVALSYTASNSDIAGTVAVAIRTLINSHVTLATQVSASAAGSVVTVTSSVAGVPVTVSTGHSLAGSRNLVIDTAPLITNITSSTANGTYTNGSAILIQVMFSEPVTVTGTPQLVLETNGTAGIQAGDARADYTGGSGTNTLTFLYVVAAGQTSVDLDYATGAALLLTNATIRDIDGTQANLSVTLPVPGAAGSLSFNKDLQVDDTTVNDAPVNFVPGTQTIIEDIPGGLTFSQANGNLIQIKDVDAGLNNVEVTLTIPKDPNGFYGKVRLPVSIALSGLTVVGFDALDTILTDTEIDANGAGKLVITGDLATINARLDGLIFTPRANINSVTTSGIILTVSTNDLGQTGAGEAKTDSDLIPIFVTAVNDAPVAVDQINLDAVQTAVGTPVSIILNATDADGDNLAYMIDSGFLPLHGTLGVITGGSTIVYTPDAGYVGPDSFGFKATDGIATSNTGTVTINMVPTVSLTGFPDITFDEGNGPGSSNAIFTITLSQVPVQQVTIFYTTVDGTAIAGPGGDYLAASGTVTFAAGQQTATFPVPINGDLNDEPNETFTVVLSSPTNVVLLDTTAVATIQNDDGLSIDDFTETEGNSGTEIFTFQVHLSSPSASTVSVNYKTVDGTASQNGDYNNQTGTLTFLPGEQLKTVSITVNGDTLSETDEAFYVDLFGPSGSSLGKLRGIGTILNDDTAPTYSISDLSITEGNAGVKIANFVVTLSAIAGQPVTVDYTTVDSTAFAGSDYFATSGTVTFAPGTTTQQISVQLIGDQIVEPDETFLVTLSNGVNASPIKSQGVGTILNDDGIFISDSQLQEGNSGITFMTFTVTAPQTNGQTVSVDYTTAPGTATPGVDYTPVSGTLLFSGGVTSKTITVPILGDFSQEGNENFYVNLSNPLNSPLLDSQAIGTIQDDDITPVITASDYFAQEGNSGTTNATFTLTLSAAVGIPVTVNYSTFDITAIGGSDYVPVTGTVTFAPFQTSQSINVPVIGDTVDEFDETFGLHLSNPTNANYFGPDPIGTIGDNDATPTLIFNNLTISEGQAGQTQAVITVSLSAPSGKVVTMDYSTSDGTAINGNFPGNNSSNDYISQTGTLTFQPGVTSQNITITINGDTLYELDETFAVNLTNFGNVSAVNTQRSVTIVNDDPKPTVVISDATVTEGDSGVTPVDFILTLQEPSALPVTVTYSTSSGQAQIGSDFQNAGGTVTFAPGETAKTITVNVIGDTVVEGDENFFVNLLNGVNVVIGDNAGLGVITNDDFLPSVQVSDAQILEGNDGTSQMTFTVTRLGSTALPTTVAYSTSNGTATAGLDFNAASGTVTFGAGVTSQNIIVNIKGDDIPESTETFFVNLSNPSNATIADGQGIGTITNDDNSPPSVTLPFGPLSTTEEVNLTISGISVSDPDAGTNTIIVTLSAAHGTIVVRDNAAGGLSGADIFDNGTSEVRLQGTISAINATMASSNGVVYRGLTDFFGADALTVKADDQGNSGSPGMPGIPKSDTKLVVINVANVNDAPTIEFTGAGGGAASAINSTKGNAVAAFGSPNSLILSDADNLNFNGGRITVTNLGQFISAKDTISIRNQGTGSGLIGFKRGKITFGGQVIGTATGGKGSAPLVITLSNTASIAATEALMKNITFGTAKARLTALPRTLRMVLTDGSGGTSGAVLTTVNVTL